MRLWGGLWGDYRGGLSPPPLCSSPTSFAPHFVRPPRCSSPTPLHSLSGVTSGGVGGTMNEVGDNSPPGGLSPAFKKKNFFLFHWGGLPPPAVLHSLPLIKKCFGVALLGGLAPPAVCSSPSFASPCEASPATRGGERCGGDSPPHSPTGYRPPLRSITYAF